MGGKKKLNKSPAGLLFRKVPYILSHIITIDVISFDWYRTPEIGKLVVIGKTLFRPHL